VASIQLSGVPQSGQIFVGRWAFLFADLYGSDGKPVPGSRNFLDGIPVTWAISDPKIASLESYRWQATVSAWAPGAVFVTATSDGKTTSVRLNLVAMPIASVTISPATAEVHVGASTQLTAIVIDSFGDQRLNLPVAWTSSAAARATVGSDGLVSGIGPGSATITAAVGGKSGTAVVSVVGP
jgi:uncharacterized protein YjdB